MEGNRRKSRPVMVGAVGVGGKNPVRIQSMTTSPTRDVEATVTQIMRLADAGCEIARVTVQGMKEAEACEGIKNRLLELGYSIPLVADIHFYPPAALRVADFVDKVRINPGNFVDKRAQFKLVEYESERAYEMEIEKIEEKFAPLVEKCRKLKRAIRIGTNHGSLSDRIMSRYGDTPRGMVESALEFTRIARKYDFHDLIFSMKSSNPQVMIQAYRLLIAEMEKAGYDYPLHLGVTEAGEGEDGRVKSAIGIGSLLLDGLGDTIRVSLTEDPWFEIDPCKRLVRLSQRGEVAFAATSRLKVSNPLHRDGAVVLKVSEREIERDDFYADIGVKLQLGKVLRDVASVDALILQGDVKNEKALAKLALLEKGGVKTLKAPLLITEDETTWESLLKQKDDVIFFAPSSDYIHHSRRFFEWLTLNQLTRAVILQFKFDGSVDDLIIESAAYFGSLFCDGLGEGILLEADVDLKMRKELCFTILQGARMRGTKTEFISCPGCGRTLFELQKVAAGIREKTSHLPGVKIAIMGCIVNGPGEMADADFGYVGSKPGKIDLYVGKECVEKDIEMNAANDRLIALIKAHGRWVEKV